MVDFTPLFRAFLEAAVLGTAIYLLMVRRKGTAAWVWGSACVVGVGLYGILIWQPGAWPLNSFERGSLASAAGPIAGAICSVTIGMADRTRALSRGLGIVVCIVGFYGAGLLLRLVLLFVP